jgi:hypothetical protein
MTGPGGRKRTAGSKARHNPFNRVWVASGDKFESGWAALALPPHDHERIAMSLINAFFQDALRDQPVYAGYMEGTILPQSLQGLRIHVQHSMGPRTVVNNFGDADEQVPLAPHPLDKTHDSLGQLVNAAGAGLVTWDDVDHTTLSNSPHNTKGVRVSWKQPDVIYRSDTGGLALALDQVVALRVGLLAQNGPGPTGTERTPSEALLQGLLFCRPCGCAMTPAQVSRSNRRYRYYTCSAAQRKGWHTCPSKSLAAGAVERYILEQLASRMPGGRGQVQVPATEGSSDQRQRLRDCVARIDYDGTTGELAITLNAPSSSWKESA